MTYTRYYHIAYYLYAYGQNSYKTGKISTKHAVAFTTPLYDVFLCVLPSGLMVFLARAMLYHHTQQVPL